MGRCLVFAIPVSKWINYSLFYYQYFSYEGAKRTLMNFYEYFTV